MKTLLSASKINWPIRIAVKANTPAPNATNHQPLPASAINVGACACLARTHGSIHKFSATNRISPPASTQVAHAIFLFSSCADVPPAIFSHSLLNHRSLESRPWHPRTSFRPREVLFSAPSACTKLLLRRVFRPLCPLCELSGFFSNSNAPQFLPHLYSPPLIHSSLHRERHGQGNF